MPNNHPRSRQADAPRPSESGFTLLEMVVAMVILMFGLLSLASVLGYAMVVSNSGKQVTNTKLMVVTILEQMETLRNTRQLTYGQIANVGSVDNTGAAQTFAGFATGPQPVVLNHPGPDGIYGTSDDLVDPGPDKIYGTSDDLTNQSLALPGYTRQIEITPLSANIKEIKVTLKYPGPSGSIQTQVGISYLNNDARGNYLQ